MCGTLMEASCFASMVSILHKLKLKHVQTKAGMGISSISLFFILFVPPLRKLEDSSQCSMIVLTLPQHSGFSYPLNEELETSDSSKGPCWSSMPFDFQSNVELYLNTKLRNIFLWWITLIFIEEDITFISSKFVLLDI